MFERFTSGARAAVVRTQDEARRLGHDRIGTEHLVLGILGDPGTAGAMALAELGVDAEQMRHALATGDRASDGPTPADEEALRAIGIELDEVRRAAEETFGPGALDRRPRARGHIPFRPEAKHALELAFREALRLGHKHIGTEHVLLGIVRERGSTATALLRARGVTVEQVRGAVLRQIPRGEARPGRTA